MENNLILITLYAVKNHEGKYFRARGYGGYEVSWVDELSKAKIYPKIGQARSQATFWKKTYPEKPTPVILELHVTTTTEINEVERIKKSIVKKTKGYIERRKRSAKNASDNYKKQIDKTIADCNKYLEQVNKWSD